MTNGRAVDPDGEGDTTPVWGETCVEWWRDNYRQPRPTGPLYAPEYAPMLEIGTPAPDFSIPNQDGVVVSMADQLGSYVLLWWYPKASTPG
ncbi:MAG: redoxin domain-containing protein [Acidimicrobiales bacterium]|nr:redoxin domain-containing protein [Acidimicrobiales bacterium]